MFGLGMMEIGLIVALAVMLFPAKELPKLVRSIAKIYGQIRRTAEDFRSTVLEDEDLREPIEEIKGAYNDARWEVRDAERKARAQLAKAQMDLRMATARRLQAEREVEKAKTAESESEKVVGAAAAGASAGAVRIAANEPDDDEPDDEPDDLDGDGDDDDGDTVSGPIAAADPRLLSARPFTPPPPSTAKKHGGDDSDNEPREGVA